MKVGKKECENSIIWKFENEFGVKADVCIEPPLGGWGLF